MMTLTTQEVSKINNLIKLYNNQSNGEENRHAIRAMTFDEAEHIMELVKKISYCMGEIMLDDEKVNKAAERNSRQRS